VSELVRRLEALDPVRVVLVDERGSWTGTDIARATRHLAEALRQQTNPGDRVLMETTRGLPWLVAFAACVRLGRVAVPLAEGTPPLEVAALAEQTGASACLVGGASPDFAAPLPEITFDAPTLARATGGAEVLAERPQGTDPAMLLFTSGTTGRPKAAILTHDNLAAQMDTLAPWKLGPGDTQLHALPLHHMHGIVVALLTPLLSGGAVHVLPRFDARRVWAELHRATVWMGVPTMYVKLLEAFDAATDLERQAWTRAAAALRLSTSGSAALPVSVAERWRALHGAIPLERFGMTEIGMAISNPLDREARRAGHVGRPLPTVETRLVDDGGADSAQGPAEVWVRGPSVFAGYFDQEEATRASFTDGWFRTGDVAVIDDGAYRLLGRSSVDILKTGGEKVSALEIEEVLREHPDVAEVAVVGVPDATWGDRVVAFIAWRSNDVATTAASDANDASSRTDALRSWAKERLPPFKVPKDVVAMSALPRNPMGKVEKPRLVELFEARKTP
jgi:malonyl-CoA/methylmalonyl-CoA synthetase